MKFLIDKKRLMLELAALLGVLAIGGFLLAVSGVVPIKASSGHWAITKWFLQFSKQRSVATHAFRLTAADLDKTDLVLKGAGQYDLACGPCHGTPEFRSPKIASKMTPHPPYLPDTISGWKPEELFYIVKHGIKFTGMPAWPTQQRDDEVWAMVAFLIKFPRMGADEYRRLADGGLPQDRCGRCHGADGLGRGAFPVLAGQSSTYLYNTLDAFARGQRHSGIMEPIAVGLSSDSMRYFANYYSGLTVPGPGQTRSAMPDAVTRGESIAQRGIPDQRVPACVECHGPGTTPRNAAYPFISGQPASYLILQLTLFKDERRGGSAYAHLMHEVAPRLTTDQMRDVAGYYEWARKASQQ